MKVDLNDCQRALIEKLIDQRGSYRGAISKWARDYRENYPGLLKKFGTTISDLQCKKVFLTIGGTSVIPVRDSAPDRSGGSLDIKEIGHHCASFADRATGVGRLTKYMKSVSSTVSVCQLRASAKYNA